MRQILLCGWLAFGAMGCGGGGGPGIVTLEALLASFDFAVVRADLPLTRVVALENPLTEEATAELVEPADNVLLVPTELPQTVEAGAEIDLTTVLEPRAPGVVTGRFIVRFTGATMIQDVEVTLTADAEQPQLTVANAAITFGVVNVGESDAQALRVTNASTVTPVELTTLSALPTGFTLTPALPQTLLPGQTTAFSITYEPAFGSATLDTTFTIGHSASAVPLTLTLHADAAIYEEIQIFEFGDVDIDGLETGFLEIDVDADAVSITIEANGPEGVAMGLAEFTGPGTTVFENEALTGPLVWNPLRDVFVVTAPSSDDDDVQLAPGGGTYRFRLSIASGVPPDTIEVRAIVVRRPNAEPVSGILDLNVYVADSLGLTAEEAATDTRLQEILGEADRILEQRNLRLGDITYYRLTDAAWDDVEDDDEFRDMLASSDVAPDVRLNLFFVSTAFGGGTLGVAASAPGSAQNGTPASGVMVDFDFGSTTTAGYVTAHEIGHYLGLLHTVEQNGRHDFISDTLECPADETDEVCTSLGGNYMMHWRILGIDTPVISLEQAKLMLVHPLVRLGDMSQLSSRPAGTGTLPSARALEALGANWCGCPSHASKKSR